MLRRPQPTAAEPAPAQPPSARGQLDPAFLLAASVAWRLLVVVAAAVVVVYALVTLRLIVIPVLIALLLATLLAPPKQLLVRRGVPGLLATWLVFLGGLLLLGGVGAGLYAAVAGQADQLAEQAAEGGERLRQFVQDGPFPVTDEQLDSAVASARQALVDNQDRLTAGAVSGAALAAEAVAGLFLVLLTLFFFVKDGPVLWRWAVSLAPRASRSRVDDAGHRSFATLTGYVRGTAVIALVDAVLIGIGLLVLQVPLALPLAVVVFLGAFVPLVGATLAGLLAALVALVANGPVTALLVVLVVVVVNQVEGDVLAPVVLGKALALHPLAIALVLTAGTLLAGIVGALLSVPLAAVARTAFHALRGDAAPGHDVGLAAPEQAGTAG